MINYKPLAVTLKSRGIQFDEMARLINSSVGKLKAKINNGLYISMAELDKMCDVLSCSPNDIIEWEEGEQKLKSKKYKINWDKMFTIAKEKGYSSTSLSVRSKLSPTALSQAKKRDSLLDVVNVISIANAIQTPVQEFAEEV